MPYVAFFVLLLIAGIVNCDYGKALVIVIRDCGP